MIGPLNRVAGCLSASAFLAFSLLPSIESSADTVANPATLRDGKVDAVLDELFSLGGYSESDEEFFGVVANAIVDPAGNSYLLDEQLCEVRVFDAEGNYLRTFGREGEGPGEFRQARDMVLLPNGKVGVIYGQQTRMASYDLDGTIGPDISLTPEGTRFAFMMGAQSRGGQFVIQQHSSSIKDNEMTSTMSMLGLEVDGTVKHTYAESSTTQKLTGNSISISISDDDMANAWVLLEDGSMAINHAGDEYEIEILSPEGELIRTITREYEPLRRSDEELERLDRERRERAEQSGRPVDDTPIEEYYDVIQSMHVGPDGQLWVMTGRGRFGKGVAEDSLGVFDVFDAEGHLVRQVAIEVPYMGGSDEFEFVGDRLYLYDESRDARTSMFAGYGMEIVTDQESDGEIEPLTIRCWKITLPAGGGGSDHSLADQ
jgi:hypothetical protein